MTKVDFYILSQLEPDSRLKFCCRLAEKAWKQGYKILIFTANQEETHQIDELLWGFKEDSFIPHNIVGDGPNQPPPIQITNNEDIGNHHGLLINISGRIPDFFSRFERTAEIVCQDEETLKILREHFRFYRDRGYPIDTHNIA